MKQAALWALAFLITASFAVYQRRTGPTYPVIWKGFNLYGTSVFRYKLPRSCTTGEACSPAVTAVTPLEGYVLWRRYPADGEFERLPMIWQDNMLKANLPSQPPAGKLDYRVFLQTPSGDKELTAEKALAPDPVRVRFKGAVPPWALVPHILFIFSFMLLSVRLFLGVFALPLPLKPAVAANVGLLLLGGFVFGPLVQKYAFGQAWTGFPFGYDLTDNKTLLMLLAWLPALRAVLKEKPAKAWLIAAFAVTTAVYLVPHSLFGSQLDYKKGEVTTGR